MDLVKIPSEEIRILARDMLQSDPEKRSSAKEVFLIHYSRVKIEISRFLRRCGVADWQWRKMKELSDSEGVGLLVLA